MAGSHRGDCGGGGGGTVKKGKRQWSSLPAKYSLIIVCMAGRLPLLVPLSDFSVSSAIPPPFSGRVDNGGCAGGPLSHSCLPFLSPCGAGLGIKATWA